MLRYADATDAEQAEARRTELLERIGDRADHAFRGSKPHCGALSPGCRLCGEGRWSCLFLNDLCQADCFFCPGMGQRADTPPVAEQIAFRSPEDYAAYVEAFGYRGVSFSGGEPFLTLDRMLATLTALRRAPGLEGLYVWAYTNGLRTTPKALAAVAEAGLDELRFNISHDGYRLDAVASAVGVVPRVTVEVPAIPEDLDRVKAVLPELARLGVDHVNLHQLMAVGSNTVHLAERGYTFSRADAPPVVESELAALELVAHALDEGLDLPVNYCSLTFKARWHSRVWGLRAAPLVMEPDEHLTETGAVRRVTPGGAGDGGGARVRYLRALVGDHASARPADAPPEAIPDYNELTLHTGRRIGVRLAPASPAIELDEAGAASLAAGAIPELLRAWEEIGTGLAPYAHPSAPATADATDAAEAPSAPVDPEALLEAVATAQAEMVALAESLQRPELTQADRLEISAELQRRAAEIRRLTQGWS